MCIWFHTWSKWVDVGDYILETYDPDTKYTGKKRWFVQQKVCLACNMKKIRKYK